MLLFYAKNLLDFQAIKSNKFKKNIHVFNIYECCNEILKIVHYLTQEK